MLKVTTAIIALTIITSGCSSPAIENPVDQGNILTFIGRSSVRIDFKDGTVLYIDPAEGDKKDYRTPADLVLVTHQHRDHNRTELVQLKEDGKTMQCPFDIHSGETVDVKGFRITAVDAYNENHPIDQGCGYIIEYAGIVIYHSGDTSLTEQMKDLSAYNIDYAMICMDGYYNMGPEEAMKAAELIGPRFVIPIHTSKSGLYDQKQIDAFRYKNKIVLKPGESIHINGV